MSKGQWQFTDLTAAPNEREWIVKPAGGAGGIVVTVLDDAQTVFDQLTLKRFGAFIVVELPPIPSIPECLEFMRSAIEARHRMKLLGMTAPLPPILVHSENVRRVLELGHFPVPTLAAFPPTGSAVLYGVKVMWSTSMDRFTAML